MSRIQGKTEAKVQTRTKQDTVLTVRSQEETTHKVHGGTRYRWAGPPHNVVIQPDRTVYLKSACLVTSTHLTLLRTNLHFKDLKVVMSLH